MNQINTRQNEPESIDKLAAQKQIYSDAKKRIGWYLVLSIPVMILLNTVVKPLFLKDALGLGKIDLTDYIAVFALLLTIFELALVKPKVSQLKEKAAKIQEELDCYVLDIEWNEILCGNKPCGSDVRTFADKSDLKGNDRSKLSDWYTTGVEQVDSVRAALLCQNENLGWDINQRQKYVKLVSGALLAFLVVTFCAGFYADSSLKAIIMSVVIPSLPFISYAITNYHENHEAIEKKRALKAATEKVDAIANPTSKYVRNIQNLIYLNRANNCLIFDWFYEWYRDSSQRGISYATLQLITRLRK